MGCEDVLWVGNEKGRGKEGDAILAFPKLWIGVAVHGWYGLGRRE